MAHIWFEESPRHWSARRLHASKVQLGYFTSTIKNQALKVTAASGSTDRPRLTPSILHCDIPHQDRWALTVPSNCTVSISGVPVLDGIALLRDRDSIRWADLYTLYFSSEKLASIEAYPDSNETMYCGRCKLTLVPGQKAVMCPQCSIWHCQDQSLERACWTYAEFCSVCDYLTDLDAGYRWSPAEL